MKLFLALLGILGAGLFGYWIEPHMRLGLTGKAPVSHAQKARETSPAEASPVTASVATSAYHLDKLDPNQLPEMVVLMSPANASAPEETEPVLLAAGTEVTPVRLEGDILHFRASGAAEGSIPVARTNLMEMLTAHARSAVTDEPIVSGTGAEPTPPEEQEEPAPPPQESSDSAIVTLMKQSLDGGQVQEISSLDVTEWSDGGDEEIDGVKYQTGLATYETKTIFGIKTFQAKALIKDGKVVRWVGVGTGLDIK